MPSALHSLLGLAGPGHLGVGVGHRRDLARIEERRLAVRRLGRDMRLVHRLVRQHRLADDVADGEDVRHVGAHLLVDLDEAAIGDRDAGLVGADLLAVRAAARPPPAPGRRPAARSGAFSPSKLTSMPAWRRLGADGLGLQHDVVEARRVHLLPDLDEVAVGALHQAVEHLDHVDARAERRVDGRHLEADDPAADHQHALRDALQQQRAGGVDDALVLGHERQLHRLRAGRDDRLGELDDLLAAAVGRDATSRWCGSRKLPTPRHHLDLARLGHAGQAAGELLDHAVLEAAQLVDVDLGRAVLDAVVGQAT